MTILNRLDGVKLMLSSWKKVLQPAVIVVALGYFVDIFDLTLFGMVRQQSLLDIGETELVSKGMILLNAQMLGMLTGGILWGSLGDRLGRMRALFASIIMYSVANLLNAFVSNFESYLLLRFLAGVGLAGELGVGITLVAELLPTSLRGLGTTLVATIGVLGAVIGGVFVEVFPWRICYVIGGVLGLLLLFLRVQVQESQLFHQLESQSQDGLVRGNFLFLFSRKNLFKTFVLITLTGLPIWYVAGILMPYTPELGEELGVTEPILASRSIAISYLGLAAGDFLSGLTSQIWRSRKKAILIFQFLTLILVATLFFTSSHRGQIYFYTLCFFIGIGAGFWALFVTVAAESFGTNLRATAATSIPNFVRAGVTPMSITLGLLNQYLTFAWANLITGCLFLFLGMMACLKIPETFHRHLDYFER